MGSNKEQDVQEQPDHLLTEQERQKKYLDRLPDDFKFPLFNAKTALESQRESGYKHTAAASREIVDNSFEAGADEVHVVFEKYQNPGRKEKVSGIAFIDDGSGMLPEMARYALTWGGGTHFDEPDFIGKFGFGLPNASINQTRRTEVYTRTSGDESFTKAVLDLNRFSEYGVQSIPEPEEADGLPEFVQEYMEKNDLDIGTGTIVVWQNPDRLRYKTTKNLERHIINDFGVAYRYLLDNPQLDEEQEDALTLFVEETQVQPVDPLFLIPGARFHVPEDEGGAREVENTVIPVQLYSESDSDEVKLRKVENEERVDSEDPDVIATSAIRVRVSRFPYGFVRGEKKVKGTNAYRRFRIRKGHRGMTFVRARREIETVDAFPRSAQDKASGLGNWPLLQSYAYHWGVEVHFPPELDKALGITNDKQGVRPVEDFWRLLSDEEIDDLLRRENQWQAQERKKASTAEKSEEESSDEGPSPAEKAATDADAASGEQMDIPDERKPEAQENLEEEAETRAEETGEDFSKVKEALQEQANRKKYRIDFIDADYGPAWEPVWQGRQVVVKINRSHKFFEEIYGPLLTLGGGEQVKEGIDLLLIALSRAELKSEGQTRVWYETQRIENWSRFLTTAINSLENHLETVEEEEF
jgi:hypothetical protein